MVEYRIRRALSAEFEKYSAVIGESLHLEPATSRLLALRGIANAEEARQFLYPSSDGLNDPFAFETMRAWIKRVRQAVTKKEKITIYSDYDADGTTAAAILYLYLQSMGADINIYTPHRHKEGYGLNIPAVKKIAEDGTKLMITVDCGITNVEEVRLAKELGMEVIITDHHECPETLPDAGIIINPKLNGCKYPFRHLCGAGVAFKLVEALAGRQEAMRYIDLAALGTIADIVPLLGENRVIASLGLQKMRNDPNTGIRLLAEAAGINIKTIDSRSVSFGLAPRINAASRMDEAKIAFLLLTAKEENEQSKGFAMTLCEHNKTRQQIEETILKQAYEKIETLDLQNERAVVLEEEGWNVGVIGIVCSQLCEMLCRPVLLFGREGENYIGSARSTDDINIFEALNRFRDLYVRFGGHSYAAGLTVSKENLPVLRQKLNEYLQSAYGEQSFIKKAYYDLQLSLKDVNEKLIRELENLQPAGQDNAPAIFLLSDLKVKSHTFVGKVNKDHLRLSLADGQKSIHAISFNHVRKYCYLSPDNEYLASLSINDFDKQPQLQIHGIKPNISNDTIKAYRNFLKQEFTYAWVDEIKAVKDWEANSGAWLESLGKDLQKSISGTLIVCNSMAGFKTAIQLKPVTDAIREGRLSLPCDAGKTYDSANLFIGAAALDKSLLGRYSRVYAVGGFAFADHPKILRYTDADLKAYYRMHARVYFMNRDDLLKCYQVMQTGYLYQKDKTGESMAKLAAVFGLSLEKVVFMANVFLDLGLIDSINHGRIQFKSNIEKGKKELLGSQTYRSFANIIE